jgi:hypothetical protein
VTAPAFRALHHEGLKSARMLMVLSSISPLFVVWAVRGNSLIADRLFIPLCGLMIIVPNGFLWLRIRTVKKQKDETPLVVGAADDHRDHLLVYLFAMILPFYSADLGNWRYLLASVAALAFIVFLFWHLNLHYMNLWFAARGYRVFTVYPPADGNPLTGKTRKSVITRRVALVPGERLVAYRLSDTVYLEAET